MTDLYSVLRNSIRRGDLHDSSERERLYEHARDIMIRKLWAFRPALSRDEIDEKIRAFDLAIGRIEDEVTYHLGVVQRPALMAPSRQMAGTAVLPAPTEPPRQRRRVEWNEKAIAARAVERPREPRNEPTRPAAARAPQPTHAKRRADPNGRGNPREDERAYAGDYAFERPSPPQAAQGANGRYRQPPEPRVFEATYEDEADDDQVYADRPAYADFSDRPQWQSGIGRFIVLGAVAFGLAAVIWTLTVSYSALFPSEPKEPVVASNSGANAATPSDFPKLERVDSTITVFDGRDPTVFEATTGNPIRFSGDAEGGFARVTSSSGSTGARAVIGPGLVQRLAGKRVRVVVTARASRESGALTSRFALQSGSKISPWTSVILSDRFAPVEIIWAVPNDAGAPSTRNFMVVQPGVPGDGTGVDIRSIRIDILS